MQKSHDLIYVLMLAVGFILEERPELFPEEHPIMTLMMSIQGNPLTNTLAEQIEDKSDEEVVMMLYEVLNAAWKQVETYH